MKRLGFVGSSILILGIVHCGGASERTPAPEELQSFGVAYVDRGASTELLDRAGNEIGSVTLAEAESRVFWKGSSLTLRWTDASLSVLENDREIGRADATGPSGDSAEVLHAQLDAILVGGMVARESGQTVQWLPAMKSGAIVTQDDAMLIEASGDCFSSSCSSWDYSTAYSCSIGRAYSECTMSGSGCSRSGSPSCSCGWFSCSCTTTFCSSW